MMHRLAQMLQIQLQSMMTGLGCTLKTCTPGQRTQRQRQLDLMPLRLLLQRKHLCRLQIFTRAVTFFHSCVRQRPVSLV